MILSKPLGCRLEDTARERRAAMTSSIRCKRIIELALSQALAEKVKDQRSNSRLFGQPAGGGVCFAWSGAKLSRCWIDSNATGPPGGSGSRGGGMAVIGYGWPVITDCVFTNNRAGGGGTGRPDGGGLSLEIGIPDQMGPDLTEAKLMAHATAWLTALPPSFVVKLIADAVVGARANPDMILFSLARQFLEILQEEQLTWQTTNLDSARTRVVQVNGCRFTHNVAVDDGGAIYASVLSRASLSGCMVENNRALNGFGGGLRASMGSDVTINGCRFVANSAEGVRKSGKHRALSGGGAVAVRNASLRIGGMNKEPTIIRENWTAEDAGGGVFVENGSEGTMAGIPNLWDAILIGVFKGGHVSCELGQDVSILRNVAGKKNPSARTGKGGGLYFLRDSFPKASAFALKIENYVHNVSGNRAASEPRTNNIDVVDIPAGIEDGDVQVLRHLAGPAYRYKT